MSSKKKPHTKTSVVVAKKSGGAGRPEGVKGRYKVVDKRMLKDKKAMKRAEKNGKKKRR